MQTSNKHIHIISGAGIAGLFAALNLLKNNIKGTDIIIIEKDNEPGGLLKSWSSSEYGNFDTGTHIIAETGDDEVDKILSPFYSSDNWNKMEGNSKDLPGCFYNGEFIEGNQYIPLKLFNFEERTEFNNEILKKTYSDSDFDLNNSKKTAYDIYSSKYGGSFIEKVIEPIYQKTFGCSTKNLSHFACNLLPLNRVISDDNDLNINLLNETRLRNVFGFPNQKNVPLHFISKTSTFYPTKRGINILIKTICDYLEKKGVSILTESTIFDIKIHKNKLSTVAIKKNEKTIMLNVKNLIWSSGLINLCKLLNINVDFNNIDKPKSTLISHVILNKKINLENTHYFYILDTKLKTYRITNYKAFCVDDKKNEYTPITLEILTEKLNEDCNFLTHNEIFKLNLATEKNDFEILKTFKLEYGFPILSLNNENYFSKLRCDIKTKGIENLFNVGIGSENGLFFYRDVLRDIYKKINTLN